MADCCCCADTWAEALLCCEGRCLTRFDRFSSVFLPGGLAAGLASAGCLEAALVTSRHTVDRFLLFFMVAGAVFVASADGGDSSSSHSCG